MRRRGMDKQKANSCENANRAIVSTYMVRLPGVGRTGRNQTHVDPARVRSVGAARAPRPRRYVGTTIQGATTNRTGGVRQSSDALAAWYRWQHSSKDGAAGSTTATDYYAYRLALEQQQARTRGGVAAILRELRATCVSRKTGSARQRTGRWGQAS